MFLSFLKKFYFIDWLVFFSALFISLIGLFTMSSFGQSGNTFFNKQIIWLCLSVFVFFGSSQINWKFLKNTNVVMTFYVLVVSLLGALFLFGSIFKGAQSWFNFGLLSFQPIDFSKLVIVILLSKYFSRRHIAIANIRHILVSGLYVFIIFILVFLQPDFGGAIIIFSIWFGMVLISGISKKHLAFVFIFGLLSFVMLWGFVFKPYQKARITSFINPLTDVRGSGYNAYQAIVAIGSGEWFGKGIGYGTQSKLQFLPEFETDFIFAAFAEEWGFIGVILFFFLFGFIIYRILDIAFKGESNFEILFGVGIAIMFISHFIINVGMNIGFLPVTGNTLPFMSYGGSHLINEFLALGILMSMKKNNRIIHKDVYQNEIIGI